MDPCSITLAGKELGKPSHSSTSSGFDVLNSRDFSIAFYIIIPPLRTLFQLFQLPVHCYHNIILIFNNSRKIIFSYLKKSYIKIKSLKD